MSDSSSHGKPNGDDQPLGHFPDNVVFMSDVVQGGAAGSTRRALRYLSQYSDTLQHWHFSRQGNGEIAVSRSLDNRRKRPPVERAIKNISRPYANKMMHKRHEQALADALAAHRPALMNVRNVHDCGINHESLLKLADGIPLVWTMHDTWVYREYGFKFFNKKKGIYETAAAEPDPEEAVKRRERFFAERPDAVLVSPSSWLAEDARSVVPAGVRVEHIPNGLWTNEFGPTPKDQAKKILGLDPDKVWMGFASTWANSRKGTDVLVDALNQLKIDNLACIAWGGDVGDDWPAHVPLRHFGRIGNDKLSALLYSACDFFTCPSRADNLPNTCLESLACATPVLGSDAGGTPDMARPGETGWLFENDNPESCAQALELALSEQDKWAGYGARGREIAETEFDVSLTAKRYVALYREVLGID